MSFEKVETVLGDVEERVSRIGSAIQAYRNTVVPPAPYPEENDESLFDTLLQNIIKGNHARAGLGLDGARPRDFLHYAGDIAVELTVSGVILYANPAFASTFGYAPPEAEGTSFIDMVDPPYRPPLVSRLETFEATDDGRVYTADDLILLRARHQDGSHLSLEATITFYRIEDTPRLVLVIRDLSAHNSLLEELRESKDNYDALSETITEAILRLDERLQIVFANSAVRQTFGHAPRELRGKPFSVLFPPGVYGRHEAEFRKYFIVDDQDRAAFGLKNTIELLGKHKNRGIAPMEVSFGNSKDFRGRTLTCIIRDITQRKNAERRLRHLAYHDQLTALGNRDLFNIDMKALLKNVASVGTGLGAVMFLDLDGFKQVNDTLGHDAGDELLIETGKRIRGALRQNDSVYRFGGDEFVVLLQYIHQAKDAAQVANKLLASIRRPYTLNSNGAQGAQTQAVTVGGSIGIALIPTHGEDLESLTKAADLAMYSAKEAGKNQFAFYSETLDAKAAERWELEQGIRTGLERGEFHLYYQPLVDNGGYVKGFEALLRWDHPTRGAISPSRFIPIAEETGLIVPLGNWVLETAFRDVRQWNDAGHKDVYVAVNLSPKQFDQRDLVETVGRILERTGANPANVKIEITETCIMAAPEASTEKMRTLKKRYPGLTIAIDDFGTGYSSLSYLSQLPADIIKIDLSFVTKLFAMNNQKIVNAIINLAHSLNLEIVAEGVESDEQWSYFNERECRTLQGFHFNKPAAGDYVMEMLNRGQLSRLSPPPQSLLQTAKANDGTATQSQA